MKVAVIGAGLVGVASAFELASDGHKVTVFERQRSVAAEASFAPSGLSSPGLEAAGVAAPRPALRWGDWSGGEGLHPLLQLRSLRWLWRARQAAGARRAQAQAARLRRLATDSQARLHRLTRELSLEYERSLGHLVLFRSAAEFEGWAASLQAMSAAGLRWARLDPAQCVALEPALNTAGGLHAGIHLPTDEVTNSRQLAMLLRGAAEQRGARCRLGTEVMALVGGAAPAVVHRAGAPGTEGAPGHTEPFDAIVVCAGLGADALLRPLGVRLPLLGIHGYSITAMMRADTAGSPLGPRSALTDARHRVVISRLGQRVRVAGGAEIGGGTTRHHAAALATLYRVLDDWFPGGAQAAQTQVWKGTRATLPDAAPVIGASGVAGIWLHLGHGARGASLACGGARLLADALAGDADPQALEGLGIERLRL